MGAVFLLSVLISYFAIPVITRAANKKHLFDHPDDDRKLHSRAVPTLGGIAIFLAFLLSFAISPWADSLEGFSFLVAALLILFFVGLKDDLVVLSAGKKLIAQITAAGLVIYGSNFVITNFHGVLGMAELPPWAAVGITFFTIIVVINAVNLIDGIDGLAGGIGAIASLFFGAGFLVAGQIPMAMFSFCLAGALLGFLYYNFSPASIFMGDTGSMLLGFLLSLQAIQFIGLSADPVFYSYMGNASAVIPIAILVLPLYDTLRVVFKRLRRSNSIFEPGQDHVHHELLRMGYTHKYASLVLYAKSVLLVTITLAFVYMGFDVNLLLAGVITSSMLVFPTNGAKRKIFASLFGYRWQRYRSYKWGLQFDHRKIRPLNGGSQEATSTVGKGNGEAEYQHQPEEQEEKGEYEEEYERMAI